MSGAQLREWRGIAGLSPGPVRYNSVRAIRDFPSLCSAPVWLQK